MLHEAFHSVRWVEEERARNRTVGPMSIVVVDVVEVVVFNDRIASGQQLLALPLVSGDAYMRACAPGGR